MIPIPNWCANLLEIAGPADEKKRLLEYVAPKKGYDGVEDTSALSLNSIIPLPHGQWDYDWCVANWGTKWDIGAELYIEGQKYTGSPDDLEDGDNLVFKFDSAWAPPIKAIEKLTEEFPKLEFSYLYAEPGVGFSDTEHYNDGAVKDAWFTATNNGNPHDIVAGYIWGYGS